MRDGSTPLSKVGLPMMSFRVTHRTLSVVSSTGWIMQSSTLLQSTLVTFWTMLGGSCRLIASSSRWRYRTSAAA